jgi:hypothetical protein
MNYGTAMQESTIAGSLDQIETPTVRENIERQINRHKKEIVRLQETMAKMPEAFLDMKIGDIRQAMNW